MKTKKSFILLGKLTSCYIMSCGFIEYQAPQPLFTLPLCTSTTQSLSQALTPRVSLVEKSPNGGHFIFWPAEVVDSQNHEAPDSASDSGLASGGRFVVMRCIGNGNWVNLGTGTTQAQEGTQVRGMLDSHSSSPMSTQPFNMYPQAMTGDLVIPLRSHVTTKKVIHTHFNLSLETLFSDLNALVNKSNNSFSYPPRVTEMGERALLTAAERLNLEPGDTLLIEVFTHLDASDSENKIKSQILADTLNLFFRNRSALPTQGVVAIGHSEDNGSQSPWNLNTHEGNKSWGHIRLTKANALRPGELFR